MKILALAFSYFLLTAFSTMDEVWTLVREDKLEQAFRLSQERAAAGDHEGEEALAWFYDEGAFGTQDKAKAADYFRRAAEGGQKHSQWRLGVMLDLGEGVEPDAEAAFTWLQKSAAQNYRRAFTSLGVMYAMGRGVPQDFALARQAYLSAARLGEPHGFFGVGVLHMRGEGTLLDKAEAFAWFTVAHFEGDELAKAAMDEAGKDLNEAEMQRAIDRTNAITKELGLNKNQRSAPAETM